MDSTDSGTPSSRERIGAKEARRARQQSERERRTDRKRGGQPGHQGKGLQREPDPDERKDAEPPAECRSCQAGLNGAEAAGSRWAQVIDVEIIRQVMRDRRSASPWYSVRYGGPWDRICRVGALPGRILVRRRGSWRCDQRRAEGSLATRRTR